MKETKDNLYHSVDKANARVLMTKAGKNTTGPLISDEAMLPPIIKSLQTASPSFRESARMSLDFGEIRSKCASSLGNTINVISDHEKLPFFSKLDGKMESMEDIPTFQEYV